MTHFDDYRWKPGEREQAEAELAERAAKNKRDEVLQRAFERQAERDAPKSYTPPVDGQQRRSAAPAPPDMVAAGWVNYIRDQIKRSEACMIRASMAAVGEVIGADLVAAEKRIAALEAEVRELRGRDLDRRLRAVPPASPSALIA